MRGSRTFFCGTILLVLLGMPAFAAERGEPNITPEMTMQEIRANPSVAGSGIFTYNDRDATDPFKRRISENETLWEYAGESKAEDCAEGLNLSIENYNAGRQVTYQVYDPEEIAADASLGAVQLYYFPAEKPNARYAIVLGGNALE